MPAHDSDVLWRTRPRAADHRETPPNAGSRTANPSGPLPATILALQRTAGNAAVTRLVRQAAEAREQGVPSSGPPAGGAGHVAAIGLPPAQRLVMQRTTANVKWKKPADQNPQLRDAPDPNPPADVTTEIESATIERGGRTGGGDHTTAWALFAEAAKNAVIGQTFTGALTRLEALSQTLGKFPGHKFPEHVLGEWGDYDWGDVSTSTTSEASAKKPRTDTKTRSQPMLDVSTPEDPWQPIFAHHRETFETATRSARQMGLLYRSQTIQDLMCTYLSLRNSLFYTYAVDAKGDADMGGKGSGEANAIARMRDAWQKHKVQEKLFATQMLKTLDLKAVFRRWFKDRVSNAKAEYYLEKYLLQHIWSLFQAFPNLSADTAELILRSFLAQVNKPDLLNEPAASPGEKNEADQAKLVAYKDWFKDRRAAVIDKMTEEVSGIVKLLVAAKLVTEAAPQPSQDVTMTDKSVTKPVDSKKRRRE